MAPIEQPKTVEPLRVEFRLVALERNEKGEPVGERPLAEGVCYPPRLDELPDLIRERFKQES